MSANHHPTGATGQPMSNATNTLAIVTLILGLLAPPLATYRGAVRTHFPQADSTERRARRRHGEGRSDYRLFLGRRSRHGRPPRGRATSTEGASAAKVNALSC